MVKIGRGLGIRIIVVALISISVLVLAPVACTSGQEVINLSSVHLPDKGNPKLDSQLNQLVQAERRGEADSFAEQSNIDLVDGNVRIIVECLPDQVDAAVKVASAYCILNVERGLRGFELALGPLGIDK